MLERELRDIAAGIHRSRSLENPVLVRERERERIYMEKLVLNRSSCGI